MTLMAGLATGIGTVAVHQAWWGLALALAATTALLLAAPPGLWTRVPFALGYAGVVGLASVPRPEGDYLLAADLEGYVVLGAALGALVFSFATLRGPAQSPAKDASGFLP
jgi:hypothetical protein